MKPDQGRSDSFQKQLKRLATIHSYVTVSLRKQKLSINYMQTGTEKHIAKETRKKTTSPEHT